MEGKGSKAGLPIECRHQAFWGSRSLGQKFPGTLKEHQLAASPANPTQRQVRKAALLLCDAPLRPRLPWAHGAARFPVAELGGSLLREEGE